MWLVFLAIGLGYFAYKVNEDIKTQAPDENPFGDRLRVGAMLPAGPIQWVPGKLVRLKVQVSPEHLSAIRTVSPEQPDVYRELARRIEQKGYANTRVVIEDPTDNTLFTIITETDDTLQNPHAWQGSGIVLREQAYVAPPQSLFEGSTLGMGPDPGLTPDEIGTIRAFLQHEDNPRHLAGFAATLEPDYPVSASLLRAKGMLQETSAMRNRIHLERESAALAQGLAARVAAKGGQGPAILEWMKSPAQCPPAALSLAEITQRAVPDGTFAVVNGAWQRYATTTPPQWFRLDRMAKVAGELGGKPAPDRTTNDVLQTLMAYAQRVGLTPAQLQEQLKQAVCLLVQDTANVLRERGTEEAHKAVQDTLKNIHPVVVQAAQHAIREVGLGIFAIDPDVWKSICPVTGKEGDVPNSALQLAMGMGKPEMSRVANPDAIGRHLDVIRGSKSPDAQVARLQVMKAEKALDRGRWVNWYRQKIQAGLT